MFFDKVFPLILDLILLFFIIFTVIRCYRRGFVKVIFVTFRKLFAFLIAYFGASKFGELLKDKFIMAPIEGKIRSMVEESVAEKGASVASFVESLPSGVHQVASLFHVDINSIAEGAMENRAEATETFILNAADGIASILGTVLGFILLFFISLILLAVIFFIVDKIFLLPVLKKVNRILGLICGIFSSFLTAWIISMIAVFLIGLLGTFSASLASFDPANTYLLRFFYHFNPIKLLI